MNLKLFSLTICILSFNVSWAMDNALKKNVERAIYEIMVKNFKAKIDPKKQLLDWFDKAFEDKDFNNCVKLFHKISKLMKLNELERFALEYKEKNSSLMSEILIWLKRAKDNEAQKTNKEATEKLEARSKLNQDLHLYVTTKGNYDVKVIDNLVANGADIDSKDEDGVPLINKAIQCDNSIFVDHLVALGANIDETAIITAITQNKKGILLLLLNHLRKQNKLKDIINHKGSNPLSCAADLNDLEFIKVLIIYGADIQDIADNAVVKSLLESKDQLNKLLIQAVKTGGLRVVDQLIKLGADKNYIDKKGFAVVHVAAFFGDVEVVHALHQHGADFAVKARGEDWNILHLIHDSYEMNNIGLATAVEMIRLVLTHWKQLMLEPDKEGRKPVDLFLLNSIGSCLQRNGIIDNDGVVLI